MEQQQWPRKHYLVPGERLLEYKTGKEFAVVVEAPERKAHWRAEDEVEETKVGFENIGRIAGIRFKGALFMLATVRREAPNRWLHCFKPWPDHETVRAEFHYPNDELERIERETYQLRQEEFRLTRGLLSPFVGALPAAAQGWIMDRWRLDFNGASRVSAFFTGAIGINLFIIVFIIGPFAMFGGARIENLLGGLPNPEMLSSYLSADSAFRLYYTSELFAKDKGRDSDECGQLILELPTRLWLAIRDRRRRAAE